MWAGFGALLVLMVVMAVRADFALRDIERSSAQIRQEFLARGDLLDQVRSNLYKSSIDVRDYLLEYDEIRAEDRGQELQASRKEMLRALDEYQRRLLPEAAGPFAALRKGVDDYWAVLEPVIGWNLSMRLGAGDAFLRQQVFPKHEQLLALSDRIAEVNARQLEAGEKRVTGIFADFRRQITATAFLAVLVGLGVAVISIRRTSHLERTSAAQFSEVARARTELRQLSARLVAMQEEERRRLSRELHDEVGQAMSALLVELSNAEARIREGHADNADPLAGVRSLAESSVGVIRNMSLLLRPSMLDDLGLVPALRWQARETTRRTGIRVRVAAEGVPDDLPDQHRTCIYRVIQEALHNVAKHAHAKSVLISVQYEGDRISVAIQDDGAGFDPRQEKGMGLIGMEERVKALDGVFHVESSPGQGTVVSALLPIEESTAAAAV